MFLTLVVFSCFAEGLLFVVLPESRETRRSEGEELYEIKV